MGIESKSGRFIKLAGAVGLPLLLAATYPEAASACEPTLVSETIKSDGTLERTLNVCTSEDAKKDYDEHCQKSKKGELKTSEMVSPKIWDLAFHGGRHYRATYTCRPESK